MSFVSNELKCDEAELSQWQEAVSQNPGLAPFFDNLESFVELPEGVEKLRDLVLDLAFQGRVVTQDDSDEPAIENLEDIEAEKAALIEARNCLLYTSPSPRD